MQPCLEVLRNMLQELLSNMCKVVLAKMFTKTYRAALPGSSLGYGPSKADVILNVGLLAELVESDAVPQRHFF